MPYKEYRATIEIEDIDVSVLWGVNNENFRLLINKFPKLNITARGNQIILKGQEVDVNTFTQHFSDFVNTYKSGRKKASKDISNNDIRDSKDLNNAFDKDSLIYAGNNRLIKAKTINQYKIVKAIQDNDVTFAIGPAGVGKTYIAVALALRALKNKEVRKIILTRPAVEAGENMGFLPGDMKDKIDPYLKPLYDALEDMLSVQLLAKYMESNIIEIAPLAFMRGRTLNNAFVILDEAQNATTAQLKMFLTRIGEHSKFFITGDLTQIDLKKDSFSGLYKTVEIIKQIKGIDVITLSAKDNLRHKLVKDIVKAYDEAGL
ncbi:MAG: PhoH family protein [Solitalea-like symbiont of Tyrophagus putrescentiae]